MAQQPNNKPFQQYQGQQVNEIPAGFVEAMGAMGQAYASIGQNIAQGLAAYGKRRDETASAKAYVTPYITKNTTDINGFVSSGFLQKDDTGGISIVPGKENMFEQGKLAELQTKIDLYNKTGGGTKELSSSEYRGIAESLKLEREQAKADREERLVIAKEETARLKTIDQKIATEKLRVDEDDKRRKATLDAWKLVGDQINDASKRHADERKSEVLQFGKVDQGREATRQTELTKLREMQWSYRPQFSQNEGASNGLTSGILASYQTTEQGFSPGGVTPASISYPVGDGTGYPSNQQVDQEGAQTQGARPPIPGKPGIRGGIDQFLPKNVDLSKYTQNKFATSPNPAASGSGASQTPTAEATSPQEAATQSTQAPAAAPAQAPTPAPQGPAPIRPIAITAGTVDSPQAQVARDRGNRLYLDNAGTVNYADNKYEVLTTSTGDVRRISVDSPQDFLAVGLKPTDAYAIKVDASGHPVLITNGRMFDNAKGKNEQDMAGMALRLLMEGRVGAFAPTDAQSRVVSDMPLPDAGTNFKPTLWKRALVAAGIGLGTIAPAPGQDINNLSYGGMFEPAPFRTTEQRRAGEDAAAASSVNITTSVVQSRTPLQTRNGMSIGFTTPINVGNLTFQTVLPSAEARANFARAGITIDAETERYFDSMDAGAKFGNEALASAARISENLRKAEEASAATGVNIVSRASQTNQMAANFGEKVKRYPGALESTGQRFGYFQVALPIKEGNTRYTSKDIDGLMKGIFSNDPEVASQSYKDLGMLTSRLSSGGVGEEQMNAASTARQQFNDTMGALSELRYANDLVQQQSTIGDLMTRFGFGPVQGELKAAEIRSMFLRGSIRPIIAGPGNPAIYEQEMINSVIPNMQSLFSIRSWDDKRIKALALVTASGYVERMRAAGFQTVTQEAIDDINAKVKDAYGEKAPQFTREDFEGPNSWRSLQTNAKKRDEWLRSRGIATASELRSQNAQLRWRDEGR